VLFRDFHPSNILLTYCFNSVNTPKKGLLEPYARNLMAAALIASTNPPMVCG
jgi:hypothetical protein